LLRWEKTNREGTAGELIDRIEICETSAASTAKNFKKMEKKHEVLDADLLEYKRTNGSKIAENNKALKYSIK
jgi:hypothetical protein